MQMDSTTPPDSVFHLCLIVYSDRFLSVCSCIPYYRSNKIYLFIYFVAVSYNIHAYTILHGLRPISYDVPI